MHNPPREQAIPSQSQGNPFSVVLVQAGTGSPSTSALLAERAGARLVELGAAAGMEVTLRTIDLRTLATQISEALVSQLISPELQEAVDSVRDAAALVVTVPVYKAAPSALATAFFQILDNDLLIGTPVLLGATAGSARHALVVDEQLRSLFAYLRAVAAPTGIFAAPEDWGGSALGRRIDRAAVETLALMRAGFRETVRGEGWGSYQHSLGSAGGAEQHIELDSDLMRLAAGGN